MHLAKYIVLALSLSLFAEACGDDDDAQSGSDLDATVTGSTGDGGARDGGIDASAPIRTDAGTTPSANPLVTPDQQAAEKLALALVASPPVRAARERLKAAWLAQATRVGGVPDEARATLDATVDEAIFSAALSLGNTDPARPKVVSILAPPHASLGVQLPGSRITFDNPDTTYRTIPVDPAARYVIRGRRHREGPVDVNFSLWDARNATLANLTGADIRPDAEGRYTITVGAGPGDGTSPHLTLAPSAASIFVRNTIDAWGTQKFDELSVERVGGPSAPTPAPTAEQLAEVLAQRLDALSGSFASFNQLSYATPVNTLPPLTLGGADGRLATQIGTYSAFSLKDDEALVLNVRLGGAKYFIAPVYNRWMITTDYVAHTQTLNLAQAVPNPDGSYTFVIAPSDPGVYNWVDTVGIHDGLLNLRWQGLPSVAAAEPPAATLTRIALRDLRASLPPTTRYVTSEERRAQLAERTRSHAALYAD